MSAWSNLDPRMSVRLGCPSGGVKGDYRSRVRLTRHAHGGTPTHLNSLNVINPLASVSSLSAQLLDGAEAKEEIAQDGFAHGVLLA